MDPFSMQKLKTEKPSEVLSTQDDGKETNTVKTAKVVRHFPQKKSVSLDHKDAAPRLSQAILSAVCVIRNIWNKDVS